MYKPIPLTLPERNAFYAEMGSPYDWNMPEWGMVVQWRNKLILVFLGVESAVAPGRLVHLTDVTMFQNEILNYPKSYDPSANTWVYQVPVQFFARVAEVVPAAKDVLIGIASTVGEIGGAVIGPIVSPLSWILIAVGIFGVVYVVGRKP